MDSSAAYIKLDLDYATRMYEAAAAVSGVVFSTDSWSPEAEARARQRGRKSPEFISVHASYMTIEIERELAALGYEGTAQSGMALLVQKHGPWPRDRYDAMSEADQVAADLSWINMGGWLNEDKLQRLARYGYEVRR